MRSLRWFGLGAGALLCARVIVGCASDTGGEPFDAGPLPDVGVGHDGSHADGAVTLGDASHADTSPGDDDASDSATAPDAHDAATIDASDAGNAHDASDSATAPDAHDAAPIEGGDAADAGIAEDAADAAVEDASDAEPPVDAGAVCKGYDAGTNPIADVVATAGGNAVNDNGTAPAADAVTLTATTSPAGLTADISLGYCTGNTCVPVYVVMSPQASPPGQEVWGADIPAQTAGTKVAWWVQAHDTCGTGQVHYWSNFGNNFHYTTQ